MIPWGGRACQTQRGCEPEAPSLPHGALLLHLFWLLLHPLLLLLLLLRLVLLLLRLVLLLHRVLLLHQQHLLFPLLC